MPKIVACLFTLIFFLFFCPPVFADTSIVINELLPTPSSGDDWIELYNASGSDIDISGWVLDDEGTATDMLKIPNNTIIAKSSFKLFYVGNRLNKNGDTIYLKNGDSEIDKYKYSSSQTNISLGRYPDGSNNWGTCSPTPESANASCDLTASPSPSPSPFPSPSPKSPSPTTKSSQILTKSPTPAPQGQTAKTQQATVLGQKLESTPTATPSASPSPTATYSPPTQSKTNKTKIAAALSGSGLVLIGLAGVIYLWHTHKSKKDKEPESPKTDEE